MTEISERKKIQLIEYDYLAPDTISEIFDSIKLLELAVGKHEQRNIQLSDDELVLLGRQRLETASKEIDKFEITIEGIENSKRKAVITKAGSAYRVFKELIMYYGITELITLIQEEKINALDVLKSKLTKKTARNKWVNIGGQLMQETEVETLKSKIKSGKIRSWDEIHQFYVSQAQKYNEEKRMHALAALTEITGINLQKITPDQFNNLLNAAIATKEWMTKGISDSRAKDYHNPFRKMVYENFAEMNEVLGKLGRQLFHSPTIGRT